MTPIANLLAGLALSLLVALPAWKKGSLSGTGALAAAALGTALFVCGGWRFFALLIAFFLSSALIGKLLPRLGSKAAETLAGVDRVIAKGGRRDHSQVFASGFIALAFAVLDFFFPGDLFYAGFATAIAASTADTWASEIGPLSGKPPVLILSRRVVERGVSGGVSLLGFAASAAGALFIALLACALRAPAPAPIGLFLIVFAGACLGSVVDSMIGELWQAKYDDGGGLTEKRFGDSGERKLVRGFHFMTNNLVNFLSVLLASQLCWLMALKP